MIRARGRNFSLHLLPLFRFLEEKKLLVTFSSRSLE